MDLQDMNAPGHSPASGRLKSWSITLQGSKPSGYENPSGYEPPPAMIAGSGGSLRAIGLTDGRSGRV
ncbi:hypothetical protein XH90_34240 [Bradyrhizobium sp. CCBAU 53338]|nr:hypothetical protein XH90_34240 [Bradyrhizobium sp. CCBAU 53338]